MHGLQRRFDFDIGQFQIARGLIADQQGDFSQQLAEILGGGVLHAHDGQLMLNQRMIDQGNIRRDHGGGNHRNSKVMVMETP